MTDNEIIARWAGWKPPESNEPMPDGMRLVMPAFEEDPFYEIDWAGQKKSFSATEIHCAYFWHTDDGRANSDELAFGTDITLWHGENGLLAEIKRRGGVLWCGYIVELLVNLGQIVPQPGAAFADQARPCWAVLCATPTQLAVALARVIKSLAR